LRDAGIKPGEVKILDMNPQDAAAAWLRKDIDGAYAWEPAIGKMVQSDGRLMLGSDEMAKRGYPTWDVGVVMKSFSSKYPELVVKYVKSECEAIEFWIKKPDESAAIVSKELGLPLEDAKRMMKGTGMVSCPDQLKEAYLGTSAKKGKFVDTLVSTATFLKEQNRLPQVKDRSAYEAFVNPSYIERHLKK
jgi:taurine transport system substrate-binding protein